MAEYIVRDDPRFPGCLLPIKPVIEGLWYRGTMGICSQPKMVAIVGSRKMSRYGRQVLDELVPRLVATGWVTISGFMYGIDVETARLTVENGGKHIAVVGWGIDRENEIENLSLYHKLIDCNGLVLSELSAKMRGQIWTFPRRNRIVVGLAQMVIVVEAAEKSGSLNSVSWAERLGKNVYAVPGSIFSPTSMGTNRLIGEGKVRTLTLARLDQIAGSRSVRLVNDSGSRKKANGLAKLILTYLKTEGPQSINTICLRLGIPAGSVVTELNTLMILGLVATERGVWKLEST